MFTLSNSLHYLILKQELIPIFLFSYDDIWRAKDKDYARFPSPFTDNPEKWFFCLKYSANGQFKAQLFSDTPIVVKIDFNSLLESPIKSMENVHALATLRSSDVVFQDNKPVSTWFTFAQLLDRQTAVLYDENGPVEYTNSYRDIFLEEINSIALRFELTVLPPKMHSFSVSLRAVNKTLASMTKYQGKIDLATMKVATFGLTSIHPTNIRRADNTKFHIYPTVFTSSPIDMKQYTELVETMSTTFTDLIIYHHNHTYESWLDAINTKESRNKFILRPSVKPRKNPQRMQVPDPSGIYRISKFGANFNISRYILTIPPQIRDVISYSLATSSWSSYQTGWKTYLDFLMRSGNKLLFPIPVENLLGFICYCFRVKSLAANTVENYLSSLKYWQKLFNIPTSNFDEPLLSIVKKGFTNLKLTNLEPPMHRSVITWPILQILGKEIEKLQYSKLDKQVIWTVALVAFWGSMRMGELLQGQFGFDKIRALTWLRIQEIDSEHCVVFLALPKTATRNNGQIVDIFRYPDPALCPITNLLKLAEMNAERKRYDSSNPVFVLSSGKLLTMKQMNHVLKNTLDACFPNIGHFTCHSFR